MCLVIALIKQDRDSLHSRQSAMCDLVLNLDEQNTKFESSITKQQILKVCRRKWNKPRFGGAGNSVSRGFDGRNTRVFIFYLGNTRESDLIFFSVENDTLAAALR